MKTILCYNGGIQDEINSLSIHHLNAFSKLYVITKNQKRKTYATQSHVFILLP